MPPSEDTIEWRLKQLEDVDTETRLTRIETEMKTFREVDEKVDSVRSWIMGIAGGIIVALVLLIVELSSGRHVSVSP